MPYLAHCPHCKSHEVREVYGVMAMGAAPYWCDGCKRPVVQVGWTYAENPTGDADDEIDDINERTFRRMADAEIEDNINPYKYGDDF